MDKVTRTGTQRPQRRLGHRAEARAERLRALRSLRATCDRNRNTTQVGTEKANRNRESRNIRTYNKNRARYDKWIENKGWWGTTADNRVPPRGTVGEPRHNRSTNANLVSNRTRNKPAESKPFKRPRDKDIPQERYTSEEKHKRGKISNEVKLRRIEQRKKKIIESRRFYIIFSGTIPRSEWEPARSTHRETRASKVGGIKEDKTRGRTQWKKDWYSQDEPVKHDDETRIYAPRWEYAKELKIAPLSVRGMREITKREQVITYMKKSSIDLLCLQETKIQSSSIERR